MVYTLIDVVKSRIWRLSAIERASRKERYGSESGGRRERAAPVKDTASSCFAAKRCQVGRARSGKSIRSRKERTIPFFDGVGFQSPGAGKFRRGTRTDIESTAVERAENDAILDFPSR